MALFHFYIAHHMLANIFVGLELNFSCQTEDGNALLNQCPDNDAEKCVSIQYNATFHSIAEEWGLVCNRKYKLPMVQSVWMGGVMSGALLFGGLADRIGRMPTLMLSIAGLVGFESGSALVTSYVIYVFLRFLGGNCCALIVMVSFVLSQEFVGSSRRSLCGIITGVYFSVGIAAMAILAAFVPHWRGYALYSSLSGLGFVMIYFFVPESPRFLLNQNRPEKAKEIIILMAELNRTDHLLPQQWELEVPRQDHEKVHKDSLKDLFSHPYALKLTLIQIYSWFVTSVSYYALTLAAASFPGNIFLITSINGLVEIPSAIVGLIIVDRWGRRLSICTSMLLSGTACLLIPILALFWPSTISWFALLGKLSISATFSFIYIHSGEIFPTVLRNSALGVVSVAARVGGILSPFILSLKDILPNLQFFTIGLLAVIAGLVSLHLPETLGRAMPETIKDMVAMNTLSVPDELKENGYAKLINEEETLISAQGAENTDTPSSLDQPPKGLFLD